jgi:hypothetical protein
MNFVRHDPEETETLFVNEGSVRKYDCPNATSNLLVSSSLQCLGILSCCSGFDVAMPTLLLSL